MKKTIRIMLLVLCLFMINGCNLYVYNFEDETPSTSTEDSSNLSQGGTGTTIKNPETNYNGFIKYTSERPKTQSSWDTIFEKVKTSVVTIRNIKDGDITSTGSGVFFAEDSVTNGYAYIFTNAHVVKGSTNIEVLLHNNILVESTLIGFDENEDVAVVKIKKRTDYTTATLRQTNSLTIGESILAIGSPLGEKYSLTATSGIISNLNIAVKEENSTLDLYLIQIDAALNPGNSGGPLFDNAGNLIGINAIKLLSSGTTSNIESFNYAIPISHFDLVASYLLKGNHYYRPYLNITIVDIKLLSQSERNKYNLKVNRGLLLLEIGTTSPLYNKASVNQVITHIENVHVTQASDFSVELLKYAPGDKITVTICDANGNNSQNVEITLIKR